MGDDIELLLANVLTDRFVKLQKTKSKRKLQNGKPLQVNKDERYRVI